MKLFIVVHGSPTASPAAISALRFAEAAVATGHSIYRVFFYHDGAYIGARASTSPQDETSPGQRWADFATQQQIELVICVSAAMRRGIIDSDEAARRNVQPTINPAYVIAGLGQYVDGALIANRTICFGG